MKVKDLIAALGKLDANLEVYGYTEDESLATKDCPLHVFSIDGVDVTAAETFRGEHHSPSLRFGHSENSRNLAFVNITTSF